MAETPQYAWYVKMETDPETKSSHPATSSEINLRPSVV